MEGSSEALFNHIPLLILLAINKPTFIEKDYLNNQRGLQKKTALIIIAIKGNWGLSRISGWDFN